MKIIRVFLVGLTIILGFVLGGCQDNNTFLNIKYKAHHLISITINGHVNKEGTFLINRDASMAEVENKFKGYQEQAIKLDEHHHFKDNEIIFINSTRFSNKININEANLEDLVIIKGIGKAIALKIIKYRQEYGLFKNMIDLMNVKGIKSKLFNKIYEYLEI
ncbi:MAG: helix-hairpin-helix domain-containing protein [Bacilli bacterium]|jgi:competence protein ComEA|nr:helix-hairpin-helix domain-containing protein [Bacilli bacterium]